MKFSTFTKIHHNGARWHGEAQATIDDLLELLTLARLDFLHAENVPWSGGVVFYYGNFRSLSHGFAFETNDPDLIARFHALVKANKYVTPEDSAEFDARVLHVAQRNR